MTKKTIRRYRVEHDGVVFTRTSQSRDYTHVVLRPCSLARQIRDAEISAQYDWNHNHDFHREFADGTSRFLGPREWHRTEEQLAAKRAEDAEQIERSRAWLAGGLGQLIADAQIKAAERWRDEFGERETGWRYVGWAGRLDLAQKQAAPGDVILEAVRV